MLIYGMFYTLYSLYHLFHATYCMLCCVNIEHVVLHNTCYIIYHSLVRCLFDITFDYLLCIWFSDGMYHFIDLPLFLFCTLYRGRLCETARSQARQRERESICHMLYMICFSSAVFSII